MDNTYFQRLLSTDHVEMGRRSTVQEPAGLLAQDFRQLGAFLGLEYVGTWLDTVGGKHSFQCHAESVPYFPRDVPLRCRVTYWRWTRASGVVDVLAASLDNLMTSLLEKLGWLLPLEPSEYANFLGKLLLQQQPPFTPGVVFHARVCESTTKSLIPPFGRKCPPGCAKPLLLEDYYNLAQALGYRYIGMVVGEQYFRPGVHPECIFQTSAVLVKPSPDHGEHRVTGKIPEDA